MNSRIETFFGRHFTAITLLVLAGGLFTFESLKATFRLRPEMPREFVDAKGALTQRSEEERIARAYWDCAMLRVQWKFARWQHLPEEPPREFVIASPNLGGPALDASSRIRYWRRLQSVWYMPSSWHKTYEWDFNWLTDWIEPTQKWLNNHLPGLNNTSAT
jgi:hypothetical protein